MTKRILSVLVAISLMFALASIGMAKSSSDDIIVSATKEMIFDKKNRFLPRFNGSAPR